MSEQHGMIEPYEPGLVRELNGEKIVSFGASSYHNADATGFILIL